MYIKISRKLLMDMVNEELQIQGKESTLKSKNEYIDYLIDTLGQTVSEYIQEDVKEEGSLLNKKKIDLNGYKVKLDTNFTIKELIAALGGKDLFINWCEENENTRTEIDIRFNDGTIGTYGFVIEINDEDLIIITQEDY